jgi:hypothetical protein
MIEDVYDTSWDGDLVRLVSRYRISMSSTCIVQCVVSAVHGLFLS